MTPSSSQVKTGPPVSGWRRVVVGVGGVAFILSATIDPIHGALGHKPVSALSVFGSIMFAAAGVLMILGAIFPDFYFANRESKI